MTPSEAEQILIDYGLRGVQVNPYPGGWRISWVHDGLTLGIVGSVLDEIVEAVKRCAKSDDQGSDQ